MPRIIICADCGKEKAHSAKGLCGSCYNRQAGRKVVVCANCGKEKPHRAKGLCGICYMQQYREKYREEYDAYMRNYYRAHQEELKTSQREYYARHRDRYNLYDRKRYYEQKEKRDTSQQRTIQRNRPKYRALARIRSARYRARKSELPDTLTVAIAETLLSMGRCFYCGAQTDLELDHFVPVNKGGGTTHANMVVACRACNSAKRDRLPEKICKQMRLELSE